jgi:putative phosphoribosyl transferase
MHTNAETVREVTIGQNNLKGILGRPMGARGLVIFAHGSGSGRFSPRNNDVAKGLNEAGLATLLLDLLRPDEEGDRRLVFDIPLLASRLHEAANWARSQPDLADLPIGYFGASTGGGAAVAAAASDPDIRAVVSRGGRPDLAGDSLSKLRAPTLLIVGGADTQVIELNRRAAAAMRCPKRLVIVPGAGHLFEEPGALEEVTEQAQRWFLQHLGDTRGDRNPEDIRFDDRVDAGRRLAAELIRRQFHDPIVLALPRGGVPVAFEISKALDAPLDITFVRKIGAPGYPELGLGAVVDGGAPEIIFNEDVMQAVRPAATYVQDEVRRQLAEIDRRRRLYGIAPQEVAGRTAIVVDDGVATGGTLKAALRAVRKRNPKRLVAAVPVASQAAIAALEHEADEIVCLAAPADFGAVGLYYRDFTQTSDDDVMSLLHESSTGGATKFGKVH